jgi:hypothetical protein
MTGTRAIAVPVLDHLLALSDGHGLFEHARHDVPRPEHGYCIDDEARAVVVLCREKELDTAPLALLGRCLDLVASAITADGLCHNRHDASGTWTDTAGLDDCWGRAVWALGFAAAHAPTPTMREHALSPFRRAADRRPTHRRPLVFAALGAGELLMARPEEAAARRILLNVKLALTSLPSTPSWRWVAPRLTYSNGSVAEALILAGHVLVDPVALRRGLELLDFLLTVETLDGHLSVTPVGGRGPGETGPVFDQQPIEVAALADACARAYSVTGDDRWRSGVELAAAWFLGDNDSSTPMVDLDTGAGYDGLEAHGRNDNRGAESTIAAISTLQQAAWAARR